MDYNEQNVELIKIIQDKNTPEVLRQQAYEKIITLNSGLINKFLYSYKSRLKKDELDDARQEIVLGFINAIEYFDTEQITNKFSSYVTLSMKRRIINFFSRRKQILFTGFGKDMTRLAKFKADYRETHNGINPTHQEIMKELDLKPCDYMIMESLGDGVLISLETPINFKNNSNDNSVTISNSIAHPKTNIISNYIKREERHQVVEAIKKLKPVHQYIIIEHYYNERDYKEIADELNMSRANVSNLAKRALEKIGKDIKDQNQKNDLEK